MKFVIASYYTKGTGYEAEAMKLKESLGKLGPDILFDIQGIDNLGSWIKNIHYKPTFIKEVLDRFNLPVLFVDADAIVHKYPFLFDWMEADIAVHYFNGIELNSSVIYLPNTPNSFQLLDAWIEQNKRQTHKLDQQNLQDILELSPWNNLKLVNLPPEYCKIFDLMSEIKDPVIELFQASRRLRYTVAQ